MARGSCSTGWPRVAAALTRFNTRPMNGARRRVYLDHHATTPVDLRVLAEMLPYFSEAYGNPSSKGHEFGWTAASAVTVARERVAASIGARGPRQIVFTSGATESNNLALKGVAAARSASGGHLVTTSIEHGAVLEPCRRLATQGMRLSVVQPASNGIIEPNAIAAALEADTVMVSVMLVNNEIGTIQPIKAIGEITRARGIILHCDAAQGLGRVPIDVDSMQIDLLSISAHKIHGPKGSGALYVRANKPKVRLMPLFDGGLQERSLRSGTLNVPGIVGLGKACEILDAEGAAENRRIGILRDRLRTLLDEGLQGVHLNGDLERRVAANLNMSFDDVDGGRLVAALGDLAVSNGAACASGSVEPSRVLAAIGLSKSRINGALRFGLGRLNTLEEIEFAAQRVIEEVTKLRQMRLS